MNGAADSTCGPGAGVSPLLRQVRSRRTFLDEPILEQDLHLLLEAARWAPSTWNAQPWRFVVVRRDVAGVFAALVGSLSDSNQRWAARAPILLVGAVWPYLEDGTPNRHAAHDLGIATAFMSVQAAAVDLHVQPMAGFRPDGARRAVGMPSDHEVMTVLAIGRVGPTSGVPAEVVRRDQRPRARKPLTEIARDGHWDQPLSDPWPPPNETRGRWE